MSRQNIIAARLGEIPVTRAILGLTTVLKTVYVFDSFSRSNRALDSDGRWINCGPADNPAVIENTVVRAGIPSTPTVNASLMRCAMGEAASDDGYIQCRPFSVGNTDGALSYPTVLYGRATADGLNGVGIHLSGNTLALAVRALGVDSVVAEFGSFGVNDIIRITFVGNTFTMFCNDQRRGSWVGPSSSGRFLAVQVTGAAGVGGRRFSPALDSVEYG